MFGNRLEVFWLLGCTFSISCRYEGKDRNEIDFSLQLTLFVIAVIVTPEYDIYDSHIALFFRIESTMR